MNVLLTNDDGIGSLGLIKLAQALDSKGKYKVFTLAPDSDRSGISNGISIMSHPIKIHEVSEQSWSCSGFPADCVILAVLGALPIKPDIVVSGINSGANIGLDILYSGTAAAARQGAIMGLPSIALSLATKENYNWDMAAAYCADHLDEFINMWENDIFINVNIPNTVKGPEGIVKTWPARKHYNDSISVFKGPGNCNWAYLVPEKSTIEAEDGSDWDAVSKNLVSVSPVYVFPVTRR